MSNVQSNIQKSINNSNEVKREMLTAQIDMAFDELINDKNRSVSNLPESIFVSYFLPFLCGERPLDTDKNFFQNWNSIAGAPTKPINIIDNTGNILFQAPPLVDTSFINPVNKDKAPLHSVFMNYELLNRNVKSRAVNYIATEMTERSVFGDSKEMTKNQKMLLDIFKRYGKIKSDSPTNEQTTNSNKFSDDELTFE